MVRTAVVVAHRVYPLLPLAALVDQRVAQPHACAQIEDVLGRDPRLRQPVDHHQLAQMPGVGPIGLGPLLRPRRAALSAGSARRTWAPIACSSPSTNRQPVVASTATSSRSPPNRPS